MAKFEIWYMRPEWFRRGVFGSKPNPANLARTHIHLKDLDLDGSSAQLDRVYQTMQGEVWSPTGEACGLIKSKGLQHTSMSVGDVIIDEDGRKFIVKPVGFCQLISE
jgi:hypothetical protein